MRKTYQYCMMGLSFLAVLLSLLAVFNIVDFRSEPWFMIYVFLLIAFWIDYIYQFYRSQDKWHYFKSHILELISILPLGPFLYSFRFVSIVRFLIPLKLFTFSQQFIRNVTTFIKTNGLNYVLIASFVIIILSAGSFAYFEKDNYFDSIWWAIVTTTTVGYGDIVPHTVPGKITAVILMFLGIGLIGSVMSTTTSFFQNRNKKDNNKDEIEALENKIDQLQASMNKLLNKDNEES